MLPRQNDTDSIRNIKPLCCEIHLHLVLVRVCTVLKASEVTLQTCLCSACISLGFDDRFTSVVLSQVYHSLLSQSQMKGCTVAVVFGSNLHLWTNTFFFRTNTFQSQIHKRLYILLRLRKIHHFTKTSSRNMQHAAVFAFLKQQCPLAEHSPHAER